MRIKRRHKCIPVVPECGMWLCPSQDLLTGFFGGVWFVSEEAAKGVSGVATEEEVAVRQPVFLVSV